MPKTEAEMIEEVKDLHMVCSALLKQVIGIGFGVIEVKQWAKTNTAILQYLHGIANEQTNVKELYKAALAQIINLRFAVEQQYKGQNSTVGLALSMLDSSEYVQVQNTKAILERLDLTLHKLETLRKHIEANNLANIKVAERMKAKPENKTKFTKAQEPTGSRLKTAFTNLVSGLIAIVQYLSDGKTAALDNARVFFNKVVAGLASLKGRPNKATTPMYKEALLPKPEMDATTHSKSKLKPRIDRDIA